MVKVSIIIVNYRVKKELFRCIESIIAFKSKVAFEIIVVDNDERRTIYADLVKRFPPLRQGFAGQAQVKYVPNENKGYGAGNNLGATYAKGEYLFVLNPDTKLDKNCIDLLAGYLKKHKDVGIVAPVLYDKENKPPLQGARELTPLRAIFAFSFINKLFPNNFIATRYWMQDVWDRRSAQEVGSVPGAALMIRREIFEEVKGFDERFFLYFEEHDLSKRVGELGWKLVMLPQAKVTHVLGSSTKQSHKNIQDVFKQSRLYYFKKHFGLLSALLTEMVLRTGKYAVLMGGVLSLGLFLRTHNLTNAMPFIGDQGWFYLSARDMILSGHIPLVGIASSHPWLHQGALWTYLLGVSFQGLGFSPLVGGYMSVFLGMLGVLGMYGVGRVMFSSRVGLIAAALLATSPLVIASDRMPYHTSPIPLLTIIFIYCLYKWVKGSVRFFPLTIFSLGILYNLEIATVLLGGGAIAVAMSYKVIKLSGYKVVENAVLLSRKSLVLGLITFVLSMLPMLIYDSSHGFPQTLGFVAWMGYKVLVIFGYPALHPSTAVSLGEMVGYFGRQMGNLIFPYSGVVALGILFVSMIGLASYGNEAGIVSRLRMTSDPKRNGHRNPLPIYLLFVLNFVLIIGFFAGRTPSDAYLPMMFPSILLLMAVPFGWAQGLRGGLLNSGGGLIRLIGLMGLIGVVFVNSYYTFDKSKKDDSFRRRLDAAKYIVNESGGKEYNLVGRGDGSQFESFTMNYEYLTWWIGHGPSRGKKPLLFIISESNKGIRVEKIVNR